MDIKDQGKKALRTKLMENIKNKIKVKKEKRKKEKEKETKRVKCIKTKR